MSADPTTVAVFVGTRADLGPLTPVIEALDACPDLDVHLLTGVAFSAEQLVAALPPRADDPAGWAAAVHALPEPLHGPVDEEAVLAHGPVLAEHVGRWCRQWRPGALVVLGDRWELLYVVPQAFLAGVRVVHLHGGEVTEGAVDERVRHAVTKLADQHCAASEDAAARIRQLGEPPERVHVTGAPGLDRVAAVPRPDDARLAEVLGREVVRPLALFTYHPPTAVAGADAGAWARAALEATLERCGTVVATHPGFDAGRDEVLAVLAELGTHPRIVVREQLGRDYPVVLAGADVVVGNSSSGVIEAASRGVPAVDVGERQRGRLRGANVVHADEGHDAVAAALDVALDAGFVRAAAQVVNPYGDGAAAPRIAEVVRHSLTVPRGKAFVDHREVR